MPAKRTLGPGTLTIGPTGSPREWGGEVTEISIEPDTKTEDPTPVLDGTNVDGETTTTWTLKAKAFQRYDKESLMAWCAQEAGKLHPFVFTPVNETSGAMTISGTCKITPVAIGGEVKKKNKFDAEFQLLGDPTITPATA